VVRLFTERLGILPRAFNAIDLVAVPLLIPVVVIESLLRRQLRVRWPSLLVLSGVFGYSWAIAWITNSAEVHWFGALLFVVGLLTPVLFFLIVVNFDLSDRFPARITQLLLFLLTINLAIGSVDAIRAVRASSADFVFGTFGANSNQLAFFLAVCLAYLVSRWRYGQLSWRGKSLAVWTLVLFLLSNFQTLWVVLAIAMFVTHGLIDRLHRRLIIPLLFAVTIPLLVLHNIRFVRFGVVETLRSISANYQDLGKVELLRNVGVILAERPSVALVGVGPAVFNSRAFRTIAIIPYAGEGNTDVAAAVVAPFYTSELSRRFIVPYFALRRFALSGSNTDGLYNSYVSIAV